jgi:hypothetical protein
MELLTALSMLYGYLVPILIEFLGKKVHGWGKVTLAIIFCLISGFFASVIENGLNYNWAEIGDIMKFAGVIFVSSQVAWVATWKKVIDKK